MKIAIGSAQFGSNYGISNLIGLTTKNEVKKILHFASNNGIDTIDTAATYGNSEIILGSLNIKNFNIITKIPTLVPYINDISKWIREKVFCSMKKLKINFIYGVLIHNSADFTGGNKDIILDTLNTLKKEGVIKKIGVSIYDTSELSAIKNFKMIDLVQAPLNLIDRSLEKSGWLIKLHKEGVEVHVRSIFLQGLLLLKPNKIPLKFKKWKTLFNLWHEKLVKKQISPLSACLSYPLSLAEVDKIIVGVNTTQQLEEIINSSKTRFVEKDWKFLISNDQMLINPSNWRNL